jgi:peptidoglycan hydrolase-like protein with peptidoglycan-binding domain
MKKYILSVAIVFLIPFSAFGAFDNDLKYGSTGTEVLELQEFLTDLGLYNGPITGNFYSLTQSAVKKFQAKEAITPVSGYFGKLSRAKANEVLTSQTPETEEVQTVAPPEKEDLTKKVADLQEQIKILTQNQTTVIQQQAQVLGSINKQPEQMTTPEIKKEIVVELGDSLYNDATGVYDNFVVSYLEDGRVVKGIEVTFSADDTGVFNLNAKRGTTGVTRDLDGKIHAQYMPKNTGVRTITLTANGVSTTIKLPGQKEGFKTAE